MTSVFFSYSHKDEQLRDDLQTQLTMLQREGIIESWHDRRITVGSEVDTTISDNLERADVILLLASRDFLASEYCWGVEVQRAMERHDAGEALVIPIILRPCEWQRAPFGKLLAAPTDGKAVTGWADRDEALLDITKHIRRALEERAPLSAGDIIAPHAALGRVEPSLAVQGRSPQSRSSNLAVKRRFTQADQDDFLLQAFTHIAEFFEGSLAALKDRADDIDTRYRRIDANRFTAVAYRDGKKETACTIWMGGEAFGYGINYVSNDSGATKQMNDSLSVEVADHGLYLKTLMGGFGGSGDRDAKLSVEQAAEHLWKSFMEPIQR